MSLQCSSDSKVSEAFNSSRVYISLTLRGSHGIIGERAKTSIYIRTHFETLDTAGNQLQLELLVLQSVKGLVVQTFKGPCRDLMLSLVSTQPSLTH